MTVKVRIEQATTPTISGYIDPDGEFVEVDDPADERHGRTILTAYRAADTHTGWPSYNVYSDETGFLGNYIAGHGSDRDTATDAITQAWADLA